MTLTRSQRYSHRFGDASIDIACSGFDQEKYLPAILGYTFAGGNIASMGTVFGAGNVACADAYVRAQLAAHANTDANVDGGWCVGVQNQLACVIGNFLSEHKIDAARVQDAGARMTARGWWASGNWYFYWCYLSGYKPFYRNPLAIAATAAAGLGSWYAYKKWVK